MTAAARYVPGALNELRARRDRLRIDLGPVKAALVTLALWAVLEVGLAAIAVGFWKAWEPLGWMFSGVALIAAAALFAYMRGSR